MIAALARVTLLALSFAACATGPSVFGLGPGTPEWARDDLPTLRWQPFPAGRVWDVHGPVQSVTYDLRIWRSGRYPETPWTLVYARDGLAVPEHTLETPLDAGRDYAWTVRARLDVDGATRVTPWSRYDTPATTGGLGDLPERRLFRFRPPAR